MFKRLLGPYESTTRDFVGLIFHHIKIHLHRALNLLTWFTDLKSPPFQQSTTNVIIPHTDADVLLDCGSPLEWNLTGMTEHEGGTPATT